MEKHPHTEALERIKALLELESSKFKTVADSYQDAKYNTPEDRTRVVFSLRHELTEEFLDWLNLYIDQSGIPLEEPPQ